MTASIIFIFEIEYLDCKKQIKENINNKKNRTKNILYFNSSINEILKSKPKFISNDFGLDCLVHSIAAP